MKFNPKIHHRRSIRLRGYDYSREAAYFITICAQDRRCIFGSIENGEMKLNELGCIAHQAWAKLPERWPHLELGAFQIMPNHMHGILIISHHPPVRATLAVAPPDAQENTEQSGPKENTSEKPETTTAESEKTEPETAESRATAEFRATARVAPTTVAPTATTADSTKKQWLERPSIGQIVAAYKSIVVTDWLKQISTNKQGRRFGKMWQRNFWEHIIRDEGAFQRISAYIVNNPKKWDEDKFRR